MMKLTILGSCSAYPTLDRFTTSQILQINGKSFLEDVGMFFSLSILEACL